MIQAAQGAGREYRVPLFGKGMGPGTFLGRSCLEEIAG